MFSYNLVQVDFIFMSALAIAMLPNPPGQLSG